MIIYQGTLETFQKDVVFGRIVDKIEEGFAQNGICHHNPKEDRAYQNSLRARCDAIFFHNPDIDKERNVAIEFQIPLTSKRIDFLLTGYDKRKRGNVVIVELKQWETCQKSVYEDVITYLAGTRRQVVHPSYQAYSYAKSIENNNETIREKNIGLYPCVYCHNFKESSRGEIEDPRYANIIKEAPLFLSKDALKLQQFIKSHVTSSDKGVILYERDKGKIKPSIALQDALPSLRKGKKVFDLIDEQKVAYSVIRETRKKALNDKSKHTIIVQGGPGTGKSVIAINLLSKRLQRGYNCAYVTKNAAPRQVFFRELVEDDYQKSYISSLFKSSGCFVTEEKDRYDCLLVDEAHRLNAKSGLFSGGENQIREIIHASKVSVFFLDEDQIVTGKDIGTKEEIEKWAKEEHSLVHEGEGLILSSQFRCHGSDGYLSFLDGLLGIRKKTDNPDREGIDYDVRLFDDPTERREELRRKNRLNNKARRVAGYCYPWLSRKNPSAYDIVLPNGFKAKWNFATTKTWAIDKDSFEQVGCIHTCQGLEFDYCGVIIGKDLRYENGCVITDCKRRAKDDHSLFGLLNPKERKTNGPKIDRIIRNTYKTLLSRGQKGCYIFCENKALSAYIKERLKK